MNKISLAPVAHHSPDCSTSHITPESSVVATSSGLGTKGLPESLAVASPWMLKSQVLAGKQNCKEGQVALNLPT